MAGIKETRVDYGKEYGTKDDKKSGQNRQDSSVVEPTRAQRPVGEVDNRFTSEESAAKPTTRPNSSEK